MSTPAWAHEPVVLAEADPRWAAQAAVEVASLTRVLAPWLTGGVHHVGSTSVTGLAAKPILDLLGGVLGPNECADADGLLAAHGWHHVPVELDGQPWRRFYVKPKGDRRWGHLHLAATGGPPWRAFFTFRDRLRADPALVAAYEAHKRALAARLGEDREAYTAAKAAFILAAIGP